jgi:hypothetical protein
MGLRSNTHGGELCIISSHRICEEHMGTALLGASSTEMMQDFPLHVVEAAPATPVHERALAEVLSQSCIFEAK